MTQPFPLELRLKSLAETCPDQFPNSSGNYWKRYDGLVEHLRAEVYPHINAGLACLSKSPGIYTDHGKEHFDEVVRYAGLILEPAFNNGDSALSPYDLFLLLMAIRLHDAGNIEGREQHERRVRKVLEDAGHYVAGNGFEVELISRIAEAHGGTTSLGGKDTISELPQSDRIGPISCSPQTVAALVRFADEICEHRDRENKYLLRHGKLPAENLLFHLYASSIKSAAPERDVKGFKLQLNFDSRFLEKPYPTVLSTLENPKSAYLLDEALQRVDKMNMERIYCNRFISPNLRTDKIEVQIDIARTLELDGQQIPQTWNSKTITIKERGYPKVDDVWRDQLDGLSGESVAHKLAEENAR